LKPRRNGTSHISEIHQSNKTTSNLMLRLADYNSQPGTSWQNPEFGLNWCAAWRHLHACQAVSRRKPRIFAKIV